MTCILPKHPTRLGLVAMAPSVGEGYKLGHGTPDDIRESSCDSGRGFAFDEVPGACARAFYSHTAGKLFWSFEVAFLLSAQLMRPETRLLLRASAHYVQLAVKLAVLYCTNGPCQTFLSDSPAKSSSSATWTTSNLSDTLVLYIYIKSYLPRPLGPLWPLESGQIK